MTRAEQLRKHKNVMRSQFAVAPKLCSRCQERKPRHTGREIVYNAGRNVRWVCADCGGKHA